MQQNIPLKRFGQHYLKDENIISKIISEISPQPDDLILEIGPGEGALTSRLIAKVNKLLAVEIDNRKYEQLQRKFPNLILIKDDFLRINLQDIYNQYKQKLRIVGNIPYNITSPILFKMVEQRKIIHDSVLMIQHEVAKRIAAKPCNKDYGILSVIVQHFAEVNLCFKVSPNVFFPRPKVFSSVIHLTFKNNLINYQKDEIFINIVKAAFNNRRKMLYNSLKNSIFSNLNFENSGIDLSKRAEQLTTEDYVKLAEFVSNEISKKA